MQHSGGIPRPGIMDLIRGMIDDVKQLALGQYELRKYQAEREVAKAKSAALLASIGVPLAFIGLVLVFVMLVHLLNELGGVPLWGCYGIIGFVLLLIGGGVLLAAKKRV